MHRQRISCSLTFFEATGFQWLCGDEDILLPHQSNDEHFAKLKNRDATARDAVAPEHKNISSCKKPCAREHFSRSDFHE